jgi:hypothetical protein
MIFSVEHPIIDYRRLAQLDINMVDLGGDKEDAVHTQEDVAKECKVWSITCFIPQ